MAKAMAIFAFKEMYTEGRFMIRRYLQNILLGCLLMLILCGCGNDLTDMEKELKTAKKKGYSVELSTKYDSEDNVVYSQMRIFSEEQEIEKIEFDEEGNKTGYSLIEYSEDGRRYEEKEYNLNDEVVGTVVYECNAGGNVIAIHYGGDEGKVCRYQYDEKNRLSKMTESYPEGTEVFMPQGTYYLYDDEGRLIGEEQRAYGTELSSFVVYVYDGSLLLKKEEYGVAFEEELEYFRSEGLECAYDQERDVYAVAVYRTEYEYDEEGRLIKSVFHNMADDYVSYITYEYH